MCYKIVINKGEKEIETPQQFKDHFGFEAQKRGLFESIDMNACLCQIDVEKAFNEHNITFEKDWGDYYVTQEKIKWAPCCAQAIQQIWKTNGGSMNVVRHESFCPTCNHYIGLTQTTIEEAVKFLKEYGLEYSVDSLQIEPDQHN